MTTVWGAYCKRRCTIKRRVTYLDNLKHRIRTEWTKLHHVVIAAAVMHQWRCRLSVYVKAADGHFEHCFLSRVSTLTRDIDIAILSVRPSVRPSVTFRY